MTNTLKTSLSKIMSDIFNIPLETIDGEISMESCPEWDSFNQLTLIAVIEEEFEIILSDDDVIAMNSFESIIKIIEAKTHYD